MKPTLSERVAEIERRLQTWEDRQRAHDAVDELVAATRAMDDMRNSMMREMDRQNNLLHPDAYKKAAQAVLEAIKAGKLK